MLLGPHKLDPVVFSAAKVKQDFGIAKSDFYKKCYNSFIKWYFS